MQDADLFMELAGIAGVFVGFGALIAVRSGGASEPFEVAYMRGVVSMGMLTVVAALAPVTLGRYDLTEHQVWALSSAVVLVGLVVMVAAQRPDARVPGELGERGSRRPGSRPRWLVGRCGGLGALHDRCWCSPRSSSCWAWHRTSRRRSTSRSSC